MDAERSCGGVGEPNTAAGGPVQHPEVGSGAVPGGEPYLGGPGAGDGVQGRAEHAANRRSQLGSLVAHDRLDLGLHRRHLGPVGPEHNQRQGGDAADALKLLRDGRVAGGGQEQPARGRGQGQDEGRGHHRDRDAGEEN